MSPGTRLGHLRGTPTHKRWLAIAQQMAQEEGVEWVKVIGADRSRRACRARWRAWKHLHDQNFPLSGIGRIAGFHHTSVMHGLRRLNGEPSKKRKQRCITFV